MVEEEVGVEEAVAVEEEAVAVEEEVVEAVEELAEAVEQEERRPFLRQRSQPAQPTQQAGELDRVRRALRRARALSCGAENT